MADTNSGINDVDEFIDNMTDGQMSSILSNVFNESIEDTAANIEQARVDAINDMEHDGLDTSKLTADLVKGLGVPISVMLNDTHLVSSGISNIQGDISITPPLASRMDEDFPINDYPSAVARAYGNVAGEDELVNLSTNTTTEGMVYIGTDGTLNTTGSGTYESPYLFGGNSALNYNNDNMVTSDWVQNAINTGPQNVIAINDPDNGIFTINMDGDIKGPDGRETNIFDMRDKIDRLEEQVKILLEMIPKKLGNRMLRSRNEID